MSVQQTLSVEPKNDVDDAQENTASFANNPRASDTMSPPIFLFCARDLMKD